MPIEPRIYKNHAVVNMDATSHLVAGLRIKTQIVAAELLKAQGEYQFECSGRIAIEVINFTRWRWRVFQSLKHIIVVISSKKRGIRTCEQIFGNGVPQF